MEWRLVAEMSLSKLIQTLFAYVKRYEGRVSLYLAEMKSSAWKLVETESNNLVMLECIEFISKNTDKLNVNSKEIFFYGFLTTQVVQSNPA